MFLGIDLQTGLIDESSGEPDQSVLPFPTVMQAKVIEKPEDWNSLPGGLVSDPFKCVFSRGLLRRIQRKAYCPCCL